MKEKNTKALISIIIPVYNAEKYISNTIKSLFSQTYKNFEVIIIDDGSSDNSMQIVDKEMKQKNIPYTIIRQANQGVGKARNVGYENANGEWILFLDADDTINPFSIEIYTKIIEKEEKVDIIFSKFRDVDEKNSLDSAKYENTYSWIEKDKILKEFLTRQRVLLVPGTLYKKNFLNTYSLMQPSIPWSEDQYFIWLVLNKADRIIITNAEIYNYVHHSGESIMNSTPVDKMLVSYEEYKKLFPTIENHLVKKYLLPRWCMGCLHILGKRKDMQSFCKFWDSTQFSQKCKNLIGFPSIKVRILAIAGTLNKKILYYIFVSR